MNTEPVVQGYGDANSLLVLGEAPGSNEVSRKIPFVGEAGRLLRTVLKGMGQNPDDVYYTNSILCRPPGNKTPNMTHLQCCRSRLEEELQLVHPTKILAVGAVALTAILGMDKMVAIGKWRGRGFYTSHGRRTIYTVATYHPAAVLRDPDLYRDFADDIEKWLKNTKPMRPPRVRFVAVKDEDELATALQYLLTVSVGVVSCDLETTGFDPHEEEIMSAALGTLTEEQDDNGNPVGVSVVIPIEVLARERAQRLLRQILEGSDRRVGWHNMKFDLQFLDMLYQEFLRPVKSTDSMLLSYVIDERPIGDRFQSHGLKALARIHYDAEDYGFDFKQFFNESPEVRKAMMPQVYEYQALDTYYTARLCNDLPSLADAESPKLVGLVDDLLIPATVAFTEIEMRGILIDVDYMTNLKTKAETETKAIYDRLVELAAKQGMVDFNPASPKQMQELVYEKWKCPRPSGEGVISAGMGATVRKRILSGARVTSADTTNRVILHALSVKATDPEIKQGLHTIIDYRLRSKTLQTYIDGILERMHDDHRIRGTFNLLGTATGRLSSSDPNLQNIPQLMGKEIRRAFIPSPGMTWVEADYAQLELRVAAALCKDERLIATFAQGKDIHREVASEMFSKHEDEVTDFDRDLAKRVDFGILYGRGAKSLVEGFEFEFLPEGAKWWTEKEADFFLKKFLDGFPTLKKWIESTKRFALDNKYIESPLGRRRRFPLIVNQGEVGTIGRQAVNTPVQGTASDICLTALINLHNQLPEGAYVLFSVHDAIYFEVEDALLPVVLPQIKRIMTTSVPLETEVPFAIKLKKGPRWGDTEEVKL